MRRTLFSGLFFLALISASRAQDFKLWDRTVQVHGFFSHGYVHTDENNWLTMNTSGSGSFAMVDMGLNTSMQVTDKFRIGGQVYDRDLGQLGQWHPSLDWAVADYRFTDWFGVRAGKVKTTLGLYNDSQDLDFVRVFALLPQSIYPTDIRDTTIAHTGADFYGTIPLHHHWGDLSYTAYGGHRRDSMYSGYPYLGRQFGIFLNSLNGWQYGGDLRWNTPIKGLLVGGSRLNQQLVAKGSAVNFLDPTAGLLPYRLSTKSYLTNQFYSEYRFRKLLLDGEYRRFYNYEVATDSNASIDVRAWYVSGSYRLLKRLQVGSYYSRYTISYIGGGLQSVVFPSQTNTSLPQNHVYDKVIAMHSDLNRFVFVKIEGHFMNGYGIGPYPDGFYPQQNPQGFKNDTNAIVVKSGFHF
jgi:hypothetical protein